MRVILTKRSDRRHELTIERPGHAARGVSLVRLNDRDHPPPDPEPPA